MTVSEPILSPEQLDSMEGKFKIWPKYEAFLADHLPDDQVGSILDIGGGSGVVMDMLLARFPHAHGVVLDSAEYMIERNKPHDRKEAVVGSALQLPPALEGRRFDLISVNNLLHHLVGADRAENDGNVLQLLDRMPELLTPRGRVVIYEILYEGWWPGVEPGDVIYTLTKMKSPLLSRAFRRFGANTAGVGVAFRSHKGWKKLFDRAALEIDAEAPTNIVTPKVARVVGLGITKVINHAFLLRAADR